MKQPYLKTTARVRSRRFLPTALALGVAVGAALGQRTQAATATIEVLGTGAASLIGGDLTDPENDGLDAVGAATDPSWNWVSITSNNEPNFEGGENAFNVFDNKVGGGNDKWCCDDATEAAPKNITVEFVAPVNLTHFTMTSGNDSPDRDPLYFQILGSNDGTTFEPIFTQHEDTSLWGDVRLQVNKFTLNEAVPAYKFIRYECTYTSGTLHQLNEIEYFGDFDSTDDDGDGMPNWWEELYGFNPGDPADAALDCNGNGMTNLQEFEAMLDPCDTTKPEVVSARTTDSFDTVILSFSKRLDVATAEDTANYSFSPALAVIGASLNGQVVTLTTGAQTPGGVKYTVTVTGVKDLSQFEVPAGSNTASFFTYMVSKSNGLAFKYWGGITGTPVANLTADPRYPDSPDMVGAVLSANTRDIFPDDSHNDYGAVMEGYLTPEVTGNYYFFLRSDDASEFWISTDDNPANLALMALEEDCCDAFMEPNTDNATSAWAPTLVADTKYFIRVIYKEGGGGDFAQVAWREETDTTPAASLLPIPGKYLSSAVDLVVPSEGGFTARSPAPNAVNVMPNAGITISHRDGVVEWNDANLTLKLDGQEVAATVTRDGNIATITSQPPALLSASTHTITLGHPDPAGDPAEEEWSFEVAPYTGPILDQVSDRPVYLMGNASQTGDAGGHTGGAGDRAFDAGVSNGSGWVPDISSINANTADDTLSVAFWEKLRTTPNMSAFWLHSTSSNNGERGFQAHVPWGGNTIYFDTSGCCTADVQRINLAITANPPIDYVDATWWNDWHHFAFVKDGQNKLIYIDGMIFHAGLGDPLMTDFTYMVLGGGAGITENRMNGMLDDFTVYDGGLTFEQVSSLAGGAAPDSIPGLLMHWDFNEPLSTAEPMISSIVLNQDGSVTVEWTGGVLEAAPAVTGPWQEVTGASSPYTFSPTEPMLFGRIRQ